MIFRGNMIPLLFSRGEGLFLVGTWGVSFGGLERYMGGGLTLFDIRSYDTLGVFILSGGKGATC